MKFFPKAYKKSKVGSQLCQISNKPFKYSQRFNFFSKLESGQTDFTQMKKKSFMEEAPGGNLDLSKI